MCRIDRIRYEMPIPGQHRVSDELEGNGLGIDNGWANNDLPTLVYGIYLIPASSHRYHREHRQIDRGPSFSKRQSSGRYGSARRKDIVHEKHALVSEAGGFGHPKRAGYVRPPIRTREIRLRPRCSCANEEAFGNIWKAVQHFCHP